MPWHRTARPTPAGAAPCPLDRRSPCPAALHRQLLITRSASLDLHLRRGGPDDARQRHGEHANVSDGHDRSPLTHLGLHTGHHGDVPRPRNTQYRHVRLRSTSSTALTPSPLVYCYSATDQTSSKFWSLLVTVSPSMVPLSGMVATRSAVNRLGSCPDVKIKFKTFQRLSRTIRRIFKNYINKKQHLYKHI